MNESCAFRESPDLSRYVFDEVAPDERLAIEAHLGACADCRSEIALLRATVALVKKNEDGSERLAPTSRERVLEEARSAVEKPVRRVPWLILVQGMAALLLAGAVYLWVGERHERAVPLGQIASSHDPVAALPLRSEEAAPSRPEADLDMRARERALDGQLKSLGYLGGAKLERPAADALAVHDEVKPAPADAPATLSTEVAKKADDSRSANVVELLRKSGYPAPAPESAGRAGKPPAPVAPGRGEVARVSDGGERSGEEAVAPQASRFGAAPAAPTEAAPAAATAPPAKDRPALGRSLAPPPATKEGTLGETRTRTKLKNDSVTDKFESLSKDDDAGTSPRSPSVRDGIDGQSAGEALRLASSLAAEPDPRAQADGVAHRIDAIFASLARQPGETPSAMFFRYWGDNAVIETKDNPTSTFSADVDTASYTLARACLAKGILPRPEQVRTEEFVNYFKSEIPPPEKGAFRITAEIAPSPFAEPDQLLLEIGLKAREVPITQRKACALTFLVDVSGSMRTDNRLELVKDALRFLVDRLDEGDRIGMVAFSDHATKVLDPVSVGEKPRILAAIDTLHPGGSTNVGGGLAMAYDLAVQARLEHGNNRVILCSDGVSNTGLNQDEILRLIADRRRLGIFLSCVGVGMGNHNDELLEQLADHGDGQCVYVDRIEEAQRVFGEHLTSTLETIARDVKLQVEFSPEAVLRYRQLGYENRVLKSQDFRDDRVDAGEVGAGHEVVALYEVTCRPQAKGRLAEVRVRYKDAEVPAEVAEIHRTVDATEVKRDFEAASARFQLSAVVGELAEQLRGSYWSHGGSLARLFPIAERVARRLPADPDVVELCALIQKAAELQTRQPDDLARLEGEVKRNNFLMAQLDDRRRADGQAQIERLEQANETLRHEIETLLRASSGGSSGR